MCASQAETVGLVLQGGGALGAFEVGVIQYLLETAREPVIVSGVSIGAVNATVFCGSRNRDRLQAMTDLWEELTTFDIPFVPTEIDKYLSSFGNPGMYRPRVDIFNFMRWTSLSDTSPLANTLEKYVAFDELQPGISSRPRLILTATNVETGEIESFDSQLMPITPDHVLASGALPPAFPAITVRDQRGNPSTYWDGGLYNNTPLSQVINALEENERTGLPNRRVQTMVVVNLFPKQNRVPSNLREVIDRSFEIVFANKTSADIARARQTRQLIALRDRFMAIVPDAERKSIEENPEYGFLLRWEPVFDRLVEIENTDDEPMDAATDFTRETIRRRRRSGYHQARVAFGG